MALVNSTRVRQRFLLGTSTWSHAQNDSMTGLLRQTTSSGSDSVKTR